jgi:hypothetical protein
MRRRYIPFILAALAALFTVGAGASALTEGGQVCATAMATAPSHELGVDGVPVSTIAGVVATAENCVEIPTATELVTVTDSQTVTVTAPTTATAPGTTSTVPVARHVLWGASTPPSSRHGTSSRDEETQWLEGKIGRKLDISREYQRGPSASWTGDAALKADIADGRVPVVSVTDGGADWSAVASGSQDGAWRARFNEILATPPTSLWRKMIVGFENEPENEGGKGGPTAYVAAYEHIIHLADSMGFKNTWTTFLMEFSWQAGSGRNPEAWVPPDVDMLGVHGYATRLGSCGSSPRSFVDLFDGPYATAVKFDKRMGIFEMGYATGADPAAKANFFRSIPGSLATKFPRIDAITYWNNSGNSCSLANSYFLDSSATALQGYTDAGHAPILGG